MDLVLNLVCSARAANINTTEWVMFLGQPRFAPLLQDMGIKTFYHEGYHAIEYPQTIQGHSYYKLTIIFSYAILLHMILYLIAPYYVGMAKCQI